MKLKIFLSICCFAIFDIAYAQNWVPDKTFSNNTNICDETSWKLVMDDEFNGSSLSPNWIPFQSWESMSQIINGNTVYGDHPYWEEAMTSQPGNAIKKTSNIHISNGICTLDLMIDPNSTWTYPGGPVITKNLSTAVICTPYIKLNQPSIIPNYFDAGSAFEAKIKFPGKPHTWCAFWLWMGTQVDEIDMAEEFGHNCNGWPYIFCSRRDISYNLHAWWPDLNGNYPNPYNIDDRFDNENSYPHQSWTNFISGNAFDQTPDWHIYKTIWDSTALYFYVDGSLVNTIWKYYKPYTVNIPSNWGYPGTSYTFNIGSECNASGTYKVTKGFPYINNPNCQLRLETKFDEDFNVPNPLPTAPIIYDQMQIDYVKIWQRHPEQDGHTDLCAGGITPTFYVPDIICSSTTLSAAPLATGFSGAWDIASWGNALNLGVTGGTSTSSMATVYPNSNSPYQQAFVKFNYIPKAGCDQHTVTKLVDVGPPKGAMVNCVAVTGGLTTHFNLTAYRPYMYGDEASPTTYQWTIKYGIDDDCSNLQTYTTYGKYVSTPSIWNYYSSEYCVKWTLKITNACGSYTISGQKQSGGWGFDVLPMAYEIHGIDTIGIYLRANVTDTAAYEKSVHTRIAHIMVSEEQSQDSIYIANMVNKIRMEELEPYLVMDTTQVKTMMASKQMEITTDTRIYPNPANNLLNIEPGQAYVSGTPIFINIYDINGHIVNRQSVNYTAGVSCSMDISQLSPGVYFLELIQNKTVERQKIVKQ